MLNNVQDLLLSLLTQHGTGMLSLMLFMGALGIPLPGTLLVFTSGMFVRQGLWTMSQFPLVVIFVVIGDLSSFFMGKYLTGKYLPVKTVENTQQFLLTWGGMGVFLTRWLITPIAVPVNWVLAAQNYSYLRFFLWAICGESLWVGIYGSLGYYVGGYWDQISGVGNNIALFTFGLTIIGVGIFWIKKTI